MERASTSSGVTERAASQPSPTAPPIDPARYAAARRLCQRHAPDLFFAAHLMPKRRRFAMFAMHALWRQLDEIMGPPQTLRGAESMSNSPAGASDCEACGETVPQRRGVCAAVLDHLANGLDTGKPELDALLDVQGELAIPRDSLEKMLDGMAQQRTTPRYATWARLQQTLDAAGGSAASIAARCLLATPTREVSETVVSQIRAAGVAIELTNLLMRIGSDWKAGRLMLPLDDLVRFELSEADVGRFADSQSTNEDPRWRRFMAHQRTRIANLLIGAARSLTALADDPCRRAAAAILVFTWRRHAMMHHVGDDPFRRLPTRRTWHRLREMPHVLRLMLNPQQADRIFRV